MSLNIIDDPDKNLSLRTLAMPKDTNANGDIFGGWLLSLMDIAGASCAKRHANKRVVTVGAESMKFLKPVQVGDEVSCYTKITKIGNTSIAIEIDVWIRRFPDVSDIKVITGHFTYVTINENRQKVPVKS